jgi:hypothetical protein
MSDVLSFLAGFVLAFTIFPSMIPLSALTQSGATTNQIITWNGSAWVPE